MSHWGLCPGDQGLCHVGHPWLTADFLISSPRRGVRTASSGSGSQLRGLTAPPGRTLPPHGLWRQRPDALFRLVCLDKLALPHSGGQEVECHHSPSRRGRAEVKRRLRGAHLPQTLTHWALRQEGPSWSPDRSVLSSCSRPVPPPSARCSPECGAVVPPS